MLAVFAGFSWFNRLRLSQGQSRGDGSGSASMEAPTYWLVGIMSRQFWPYGKPKPTPSGLGCVFGNDLIMSLYNPPALGEVVLCCYVVLASMAV